MRSSMTLGTSDVQGSSQDGDAAPEFLASNNTAIPMLIDSLLHDARNPLNALSINLEVLNERLRRQAEALAPAFEKNIRVMREQIVRVDNIMREFAEFISPRSNGSGEVDFSQRVLKALEVLGHEVRKKRLTIRPVIEAGVRVSLLEASAANYLALHCIHRGIARSDPGGELVVTVKQENGFAVLRVTDAGPAEAPEPSVETLVAVERMARQQAGRSEILGTDCVVYLPLP